MLVRIITALAASFFIASCSVAPTQPGAADRLLPTWTGRLAVQVEGDPPQSASAAFVLEGSARAGQLWLNSPLGTTLAWAQWQPGLAQWRSGTEVQGYESVEALMQHTLGTPLPLDKLFAWMDGQDLSDTHWQADLSRHAQGRWVARRLSPPQARLSVIMDQAAP